MARMDAAREAVDDMQALAMRLARRPQVNAEDIAQLIAWAFRIDEALAGAQRMGVTMGELAQLVRTLRTEGQRSREEEEQRSRRVEETQSGSRGERHAK